MDYKELSSRYVDAWNKRSVSDLLKILHPEASYYDAFWGEQCAGKDLGKYFKLSFETETRWYRASGEPMITPNGFVLVYEAFDDADTEGAEPVFFGADIITIADGLILTVSDFYVDLVPADLVEISKTVERRHAESSVAPLGMSARAAARIKRSLAAISDHPAVLIDPNVSVTRVANHIGCSVMHLFHILENEFGTTFIRYIEECRARHATTMLTSPDFSEANLEAIGKQCGFDSLTRFIEGFERTFGMDPLDYARQFKSGKSA